jgi:hypothetical protein
VKLRRANRTAGAAAASPAFEGNDKDDDVFELTVHLVGRICLIEHDGDYTALFLDVQKNPELGFREHRPVVRAPLDDTSQSGADLADVSFADPRGRAQVLWRLKGHDMVFDGLIPPSDGLRVELDSIVDLRAAYDRIKTGAEWLTRTELLGPEPATYGIAARLSLKDFDRIDSLFFDKGGVLKEFGIVPDLKQERIYFPGGYAQDAHAIIRCTAKFKGSTTGRPALVLTPFDGGEPKRITFDDRTNLLLTFSNLCNCVGIEPPVEAKSAAGVPLVLEDHEFAVYYELLAAPPAMNMRPVPFFPDAGAGGGGVPECIPPSKLKGT